jgi:PHD-finger/Zinc finger, C3HC4 type (RING finger)
MLAYKRKRLHSFRVKDFAEISNSQQCLICMNVGPENLDRGILDCLHSAFCFKCIIDWSNITNKCPLCKRRFYQITNSNTRQVINTSEKDQKINDDGQILFEIRCTVCGSDLDDDIMLLCDTCDKGFHTTCLGMYGIPDIEHWFCDQCMWDLNLIQRKQLLNSMKKVGRAFYPEEIKETDKKSRKRLRKLKEYPDGRRLK